MAWWYVSPLESSSVRNIARYDHHYVPVTQDGLSCSPGYFDRLLDEEPIKKSNIFDNSSVQISPQVIPSEIICSLLSSNPIAKIDTEVAPNGRPKVKSFQGDPIFLVPQQSGGDTGPKQSSFLSAQSACNLGPRSRDPSRNVSRDQSKSPRRESEPTSRKVSISEANESRAIETIQAMNVHNNSGGVIPRGNSLPVQGSLPSPGPMQVVHGNVMTLLRGGRGSTIHHVEANTAIGSVGGVMGGSSGITGGMMMSFGPDRPDDARKDSNTTAKQSQTSDETSKAFHSSGGGGGKSGTSAGGGGTTTFDESRDADDEASSGKTSSSESDEFLRKIAIMANEAPLHHANLFRRPIEEFGLFVDTTLGHRLHIHKVEPGSNAFIEGLAPGDQILAINNKTVGQHDCDMDFDEALKSIRTNLSLHVIVAKCVNSYHKMPCKRIVVDLRNSSDGLGLSIGKNCENKLVIKGINTGGVAFKDGRVKRGDQILKISGVFTENLSTDDVGKLLKNSGKMVKLEVLQPNPHGEILVHVNLKRHPKFGLGLGVAIYTSKLNETCTIIRNILPLSPADRNAKLSLDDELVAINGRSTCTMNSNEILDLLKNKAISHYSIQIRQKERNKEYLTTKRPKKSEEKEPCCISGPFFKPH